jgi:hypothetical protein
MFVTPPEVFSLAIPLLPVELTVIAVSFSQIYSVRAVFLVVPSMIIAMIPVVVPPFIMVIVSGESHRNE